MNEVPRSGPAKQRFIGCSGASIVSRCFRIRCATSPWAELPGTDKAIRIPKDFHEVACESFTPTELGDVPASWKASLFPCARGTSMHRHKNPLEFSCCGHVQLAEMGGIAAVFCQKPRVASP